MDATNLKPSLKKLYQQGVDLKNRIDEHLSAWPLLDSKDETHYGRLPVLHEPKEVDYDSLPSEKQEMALEIITDVRKWFNALKVHTRKSCHHLLL
jgi:hypothetical protein